MEVSDVLIEEMLEDLAAITRSLEIFADRWSIFGENLHPHLSEKQRKRIEAGFKKFTDKLDILAEG